MPYLHTGAMPNVVRSNRTHGDPRVKLVMYSHVIAEDRRNAVDRVVGVVAPK